jgi:DNA-binding response OmpR family regulator
LLRVLLVESDAADEEVLVAESFTSQGYLVERANDSGHARTYAAVAWPDLVVLNICSGLSEVEELCESLAENGLDLPRLVVHDGEAPRHLRAEAYIAVPFTARKLSFRIKRAIGDQMDRFTRVGDLIVDRVKRTVKSGDRVEPLTPKEMRLLLFLMTHPGTPLNRGFIMRHVWDTDYVGDTRTLEVHIRWLRKKVEDNPKRPAHILTVRRTGYKFQV